MSRLRHSGKLLLLLMLMILRATKVLNSKTRSRTPLLCDFCIARTDFSVKTISVLELIKDKHKIKGKK